MSHFLIWIKFFSIPFPCSVGNSCSCGRVCVYVIHLFRASCTKLYPSASFMIGITAAVSLVSPTEKYIFLITSPIIIPLITSSIFLRTIIDFNIWFFTLSSRALNPFFLFSIISLIFSVNDSISSAVLAK